MRFWCWDAIRARTPVDVMKIFFMRYEVGGSNPGPPPYSDISYIISYTLSRDFYVSSNLSPLAGALVCATYTR